MQTVKSQEPIDLIYAIHLVNQNKRSWLLHYLPGPAADTVATDVRTLEEAGTVDWTDDVGVETDGAAVLPIGVDVVVITCEAMTGVSSDCWIIFTPSGFDQADSRVRAL